MEQNSVPQLVVLDYDRTLGDTAAAMERLFAVLQQGNYTVNPALLIKAQEQAEKTGKSFSPLEFMKRYDDVETLRDDFLHFDDVPLFYDDAPLFLQVLEAKNVPYMVMSYGADPEWQDLKIRASGYNGPLEITESQEKGTIIANLKTTDGKYEYKTDRYDFRADSVCLIDDKAVSFIDLPEDCSGVWLQRSQDLLIAQQGEVPARVQIARSLEELTVKDGRVEVSRQNEEQ